MNNRKQALYLPTGEEGDPLDKLDSYLNEAPFAEFREAWDDVRNGQVVPTRKDVSLRRFSKFVNDMQILTREGTGQYRYRQIGEGVRGGLRGAGKGDDGFSLISDHVKEACATFIDAMFTTPCGGLMDYSIDYPGLSLGRIRTVHLPVLSEKTGECLLIALNKVVVRSHTLTPNKRLLLGDHLCQATVFDVGRGLPDDGSDACAITYGDPGYLIV